MGSRTVEKCHPHSPTSYGCSLQADIENLVRCRFRGLYRCNWTCRAQRLSTNSLICYPMRPEELRPLFAGNCPQRCRSGNRAVPRGGQKGIVIGHLPELRPASAAACH